MDLGGGVVAVISWPTPAPNCCDLKTTLNSHFLFSTSQVLGLQSTASGCSLYGSEPFIYKTSSHKKMTSEEHPDCNCAMSTPVFVIARKGFVDARTSGLEPASGSFLWPRTEPCKLEASWALASQNQAMAGPHGPSDELSQESKALLRQTRSLGVSQVEPN